MINNKKIINEIVNNEKNIHLYKRKLENWKLKLNVKIAMLFSQFF